MLRIRKAQVFQIINQAVIAVFCSITEFELIKQGGFLLRIKKPKASSEEAGHPLCAARVENEKLFERSELFFV